MDTVLPIENCDGNNLELAEFENRYLKESLPVVIKSYFQNLSPSKWKMDYLLEKVGSNTVSVRGNTNVDSYKVGKEYIIRETTFKEYVSDLRKRTPRGLSSYMAVQNISKTFPQLQDECELPKHIGKVHNGPFLWVARQGHYEYCHFDPDASMLMMIEGRKQVRLYPCQDLKHLYPNPLGSRGKTVQSQVECDNPNLKIHPEFSKATNYFCTLDSGDMLFIPAFWWHQVSSLTDSVSMNVFFGDQGTDKYIIRIMEPPVWCSFKYWLLNIVEQNRFYPSFTRTLERLHMCVEYLLLKHFHEVAPESHVNELVKVIKDYLGLKELPEFKGGGKHPPPLKVRGLRWR